MATRGKKISEQTLATNLDGNEIIPFAKNGADGAVKASKIKEYVQPDLTAKQDKLVNSDDVTIGIDNKLTVTDLAKMKVFIDQCKAEGAVYNSVTGYFELNGLVDITMEQMRQIMPYLILGRLGGSLANRFERTAIRTITVYAASEPTAIALNMTFYASFVETIAFKVNGDKAMKLQSITQPFRACPYLHTIYGIMDVGNAGTGLINIAPLATKLKYINIQSLKTSITFQDCPVISLESITYMVENAINTDPITITLHPDAYARLTDEIITAATAKQINFATTT